MITSHSRYFGFILLAFLYTNIGISQTCNIKIKGQVTDFHDHHYLEYATVYIQETKKGIITDEKGNFEFNEVCPGYLHIVLSHIGCGSKTIYAKFTKDTVLQIIMEHHDELLDEVIIQGQGSQSKTGLLKSVISKEMMLEMSGSNLSEMLAAIPGVSLLRSGPNLTKPIIQGLYGNRITILNHGIPQEGQQWGNDHAPEIDPNTSDKISIYKGASAIKYGLSTLGGLVVLEPNDLIYDPHWHGEVKVLGQTNGRTYGLQTALRKSTRWGNTKWTGSFANSGDRHAPDYFLTNTGNKEQSLSLLWSNDHVSRSYRKFYYSFYQNEIGILRGSHIGNLTDLKEAFTREEPFFTQDTFGNAINAPRQNVQHHLAKYSHKYTFSDAYSLNVDAALQVNLRQEYDVRRGGRSNTPSLDLSLFSQFYDIQLNRRTEDTNLQHSVGIQYKNNNNTNNPGTGIRPLIPNYLNHQIALYAIFKEQWHAIPLEFGLRSEYRKYNIYRNETAGGDAHHDFLNIGANLGLKKQITKLINATLDISYTQRPAEVNELYSNGLHQGVSGIEEGNTKLTSEKSFKIVHEWNGHINHHHHINMAFFYNKFWQYIYLQPTDELRLTIRGAFPVFRYVGADVNMAGFSFKSNWNINHQLLWSNAIHYTYAQNLTLGQGLIRIPPLNTVSNISYTLGKSKAYSEMKIGTELSYTAKQTNVNLKEDFLSPPESYFLINAFIRAKWKTTKQNDLDLIVRCENLLNSTYRDYLNRLRYFADEMGRNIYVSINMSF